MKQQNALRLLLRGIGVLHRLSPWNLLAKCVRSVCNAAMPFANLYLSARILDALAAGNRFRQVFALALLTVLVNLALVLVSKEMDAVNYRKWNQFYLRYHFLLGEKAQSLRYEQIEDVQTHRMIKRIEDATRIGNYGLIKLHSRIPLLVEHGLKVCFSVAFLLAAVVQKTSGAATVLQRFANSWAADLLLFALMVGAAAVCARVNRRIADRSYEHLGRLSRQNRVLDFYFDQYLDSHRAGKDIRLYRQDRLIADELQAAGERNGRIVDALNREVCRGGVRMLLANVPLLLYTYAYIGLKSMAGVFAVGSIVQYSGGVLQFAGACSDTMDAFSQLRANTVYLRDFFAFLDLPTDRPLVSAEPKPRPAGSMSAAAGDACRLEVCHVSFRYPGTQEDVLRDISFTIRPGERIAIVGQNGSGKTTMIKLLCRLYDPTEGEIRYNGVDIRQYDLETYWSLLGVVFQDFKLFSFPLGQNVASGMEVNRQRAEECLQKAGLEQRLQQMQQGLDTYLYRDFDPSGVEISGGEAQKIALARALYRDTPLIILDEPTAALDPIAESEIYAHLAEIVGQKTAIFISHRLSSCRFCDRIFVFSDRHLVQEGTHDALLAQADGCYAALWNAQAQYYAEEETSPAEP